jgi:hypothetical protein
MYYKPLILTIFFLNFAAYKILAMEPEIAKLAPPSITKLGELPITNLRELYDISGKLFFESYKRATDKKLNLALFMVLPSRQCIKCIYSILSNALTEARFYGVEGTTDAEKLKLLNDCKEELSNNSSSKMCTYIDQMRNKTVGECHLFCSAFFFSELLKNEHINYLFKESALFKTILFCDINYIVKICKETINSNSNAERGTTQSSYLLRSQTPRVDDPIRNNPQSQAVNNKVRISMNKLGLSLDRKSSSITKVVKQFVKLNLLFVDQDNLEPMKAFASCLKNNLTGNQVDILLGILPHKEVDLKEKQIIAQKANNLTPENAGKFLEDLKNIAKNIAGI